MASALSHTCNALRLSHVSFAVYRTVPPKARHRLARMREVGRILHTPPTSYCVYAARHWDRKAAGTRGQDYQGLGSTYASYLESVCADHQTKDV